MIKEQLKDLLGVKSPLLTFVWAEAKEGVIGYKNTLPWHLPEEMAWFKQVTTGDTVVMGRGTYKSIPKPPLKNRRNIVLSAETIDHEGVETAHNLTELENLIKDSHELVHIIGGASLFEQLKDTVDILIQTKIDHDYPGDTWMSDIDWDQFVCVWEDDEVSQTDIHFTKSIYLRKYLSRQLDNEEIRRNK